MAFLKTWLKMMGWCFFVCACIAALILAVGLFGLAADELGTGWAFLILFAIVSAVCALDEL